MRLLVMVVCFLATLCVCKASWSLDPDDPALVGLWLCDEGDGDTMVDTSGNGNDATGSFDWAEGKFGDGIDWLFHDREDITIRCLIRSKR